MPHETTARRILNERKRAPGWALLEALEQAEQRAIVRKEMAEHGISVNRMANILGISRRNLVAFLDGFELADRARTRVGEWCHGRSLPYVHAELVAVGLLCVWFPARHVREAQAELWSVVREMYRARGIKLPGFLTDELDPLLVP